MRPSLILLLVAAWLAIGCERPTLSTRATGRVSTSRAPLVVVDDTTGAPATLGQFGQDALGTYGQVVTVPASNPLLTQFGVLMLGVPASVVFRGEVYAWDGAKATGPSLYESAATSTSGPTGQVVTFDTGPLELGSGSDYVVFVSTSKDAGSGAGDIGGQPGSSYAGGAALFLDSGSDPTSWTSQAWSSFSSDSDLAFTATFDAFVSTTALVSSRNPSTYGQSVTFTTTVDGAQATPTGTVTFTDGTTTLGAVALDGAGRASLSTALLDAGAHSVVASYGGSSVYDSSASSALSQVVRRANSTTVVVSSASPAVIGQSVTLTATVARLGAGAGVPSGTVTFADGSAVLGTGTLDASGVASFTTAALALGTHSVTASYGGDGNFNASASPLLGQAVNQDGVTITVTGSPAPSTYPASVAFTATVVAGATSSGAPTGSVTFKDGATTLGASAVGANGVAVLATTALLGGSHTIVASYGGDTNHLAASTSVKQVVTPAVSTSSVATATNPSVFGQTVTFTATVSGAGVTPAGMVTFFDGTTALGARPLGAAGQANLSISSLAVGTRTITLAYAGDSNYRQSTSVALQQQVNHAATATKLTSSSTPSITGAPVTFTAAVAAVAPGAGAPTGAVTFHDGSTVLGTGALNASGVATFVTRVLAVRSHNIAADYAGDADFAASTSATLPQVVNQDGASVSLTSSANPSIFGSSVTFTARVTSVGPGGAPTGTVTFRDGTATLGTATLNASSVATYTVAALPAGPHAISAAYAGDADHVGGAIATVTQGVDPAPTSLALSSSASPSAYGQNVVFTATATAAPTVPFAGTLTFLDGQTALGSSNLDASGKATFSTSALPVGAHSLRVAYGGDSSHAASTSAALSQAVDVAQTSTALTPSTNPSVAGKTLTLTATVSVVAPGSGVPTGMVTFSDGNVLIGGTTVDGNGVATLDTGMLSEGRHSLTAAYAGDGTFAPSTSAALSQKVAIDVTTVMVVSSTSPGTYGATVTLTATVVGSLTTPTGSVTFRDGTTALGMQVLDASGKASFSTSDLAVGTHTLSAEYAGDADNAPGSGTLSELVAPAPTTTTLTSDANPSPVGEPVTFTATISSDVAGFGGDVEFFDGTTSLGSAPLTGTSAAFQVSALAEGGHAITATYKGDESFEPSTSDALTETIGARVVPPATDGGARSEGGAPFADAGPPMDGGVTTGSGEGFLRGTSGGACGCRTSPRSTSERDVVIALAGLAALTARRCSRSRRDRGRAR